MGTVKKGGSGKFYVVVKDVNGRKYWKARKGKVANSQKTKKAKGKKSKKSQKKKKQKTRKVVTKKGKKQSTKAERIPELRYYVDNAMNRKLDRVGRVLKSMEKFYYSDRAFADSKDFGRNDSAGEMQCSLKVQSLLAEGRKVFAEKEACVR